MRLSSVTRVGVLVAAVLAATVGACASAPSTPPTAYTYAPSLGVDLDSMTKTNTGLYYEEVTEGSGREARRNDRVTIHYTGYLPDGRTFDASRPGPPIEFRIGNREVVPGMEEGVRGMKEGGVRLIVVPPDMAYGARGSGKVPGDMTLIFRLELVRVN